MSETKNGNKKVSLKLPKIAIPDKGVIFLRKIGEIFKGWKIKLVKCIRTFLKSRLAGVLSKVLIVVVILFAFVEVAAGVMLYGLHQENKFLNIMAKIVPMPVAVVNYDFITYNDYLREKEYIHHFYDATQQGDVSFGEIDSQILDQLIENKIIVFEASKSHIKVDRKEIDITINTIIDQNGGQEKVEKVLSDLYGLSLKDFRKLVTTQLLRDKVNNSVIAKVEVGHILIRVDQDATEEKVTEGRTKIEGILADIRDAKISFEDSAKKNSEDIGSAEQGGRLEAFAAGEMVPEFSDMAFETNVEEISEPVRTEFGWHIIKVYSKTGSVEMKFADWVQSLRSKSLILKLYSL
ncbi:MAG: peptidylprolyl isomerase [Patescibacteria group bacterium]